MSFSNGTFKAVNIALTACS